jgi:3-oxoadipate enol-lactonase
LSSWIAFQIAGDEGMPLVFLHGVGGDAETWRLQLDHFSRDFRAVAWDMPGYGDSAPLDEMTIETLVSSVATLLDRLSVDRAHLVGHAFGGLIARAFAASYPERLWSLTLSAAGPAMGNLASEDSASAWRQRFLEQQLGPLDRGASMTELAPKLVQGMIGDEADPKGLEQAILSLAAVPEAGYRAAITCLAEMGRESGFAEIQTPTLLIAGEKDPISPPSVMQAMVGAMPNVRFETMKGTGHLPHLERSDLFNHLLEDFLRSLVKH